MLPPVIDPLNSAPLLSITNSSLCIEPPFAKVIPLVVNPEVSFVDPELYIASLSIFHPPIVPSVAVILPLIVAFSAVKAPAGVTLKGAEANVACPKDIPLLFALNILLAVVPISIVEPEINPLNVALPFEAILNCLAPMNPAPNVICPFEVAKLSSDNSVPL